MKYRILPIIVIAVLIVNGCSQRATPTSDSFTSTPASTQTPDRTLKVVTETTVIETPTVSPTKTPEQNSNLTFQCLDVQSSIPTNFESAGNIVLKDYFDNRALYAIQPSSDNSNTIIFGENFLAPVISPNGKILAFLDEYGEEEDTTKLILVNSNNEVQRTIRWQWGFIRGPVFGWINDNQLAINPYDHDQMIVFDPFADDVKNIAFDQFPEFDFILNIPWADYDPTLSRIIYPKGGALVLFDTESRQALAEIPTGVVRLPTDASWTKDGNFVVVIGSVAPSINDMGDELFVVSRNGIVEQLTHLTNHYGEGLSLSAPSWSPDGKHIAFWETDSLNKYQDRKLVVVDVNTMQVTNYCISNRHNGNFGEDIPAPIWSPDGAQILIENRYSQDHNNVILLDIVRNIAIQIAQDARPIGWMTPP